jgi:SOS-response transcriptional repressor LexA
MTTQSNTPPRGELQPASTLPPQHHHDSDDGERRRAALRRLLASKNITPTYLARLIRLPNANAIYNHLGGRSAALSLETVERIVSLFPDVAFTELVGLASRKPADLARRGTEVPSVPVTMELEAGAWRADLELPAEQWTPLPLPWEFARNPEALFAARVKEPGAEEIYPANTILLCRNLAMDAEAIEPGTRCIVKRTRRDKVEVTVRELRHTGGAVWLWPRSTDPFHQRPLQLATAGNGVIAKTEGLTKVEIIGSVVASWQPERAAKHS